MKAQLKTALWKSIHFLGIPVIALILMPFLWAYWSKSSSEAEKPRSVPKIASPSQLPSPQVPSPSISSLKPPQPKLRPPSERTSPKSPSNPKKNQFTAKNSSPSPQVGMKTTQAPHQAQSVPIAPLNLEIRVAILREASYTTLGVSGQTSVTDRHGHILKTLTSSQGVGVTPNGNGLNIGDWKLPAVVWVQPAEGELIYLGDRWYRGKILLVSQGNQLLAVNYVDLEHYLYSVVGSEMHADAPPEALKAQAIAARSYALVHIIRPASDWYDLGNTQRWQVYKGVNSEYNTTQQAVQATMGQILSYQGGVVESLYAATDEIVARAHSGRGMSQTGAYKLARQGYDHQGILGHYYPGVTLAKVILNP